MTNTACATVSASGSSSENSRSERGPAAGHVSRGEQARKAQGGRQGKSETGVPVIADEIRGSGAKEDVAHSERGVLVVAKEVAVVDQGNRGTQVSDGVDVVEQRRGKRPRPCQRGESEWHPLGEACSAARRIADAVAVGFVEVDGGEGAEYYNTDYVRVDLRALCP